MILDGVLFLAAYTARSQAYAQAMARVGLSPSEVLMFGDPSEQSQHGCAVDGLSAETGDVFLPDLGVSLEETCNRAGWNIRRTAIGDINHPDFGRDLTALRPRLVIFSGYGGQLLKPGVLGLGLKFLHIHNGWLPDYRGSTIIYYSWLEGNRCAATALFLNEGIDTGPIIARRHYPLPPPGLDVDHLYDNAIRADLLVKVLNDYATKGELATIANEGEGRTYYVIRPVLKHLALLSREPA